ncbi:MAG TPA: type II toxin-antitoxin system prevent-host-death family antitoxin [Geminicoccaceae bacterium]
MSEIELHVAEVYLDGLIDRVERGETVTITRDGVPIARMVPVTAPARSRDGGQAQAATGQQPRLQRTP